MSSGEGSKDTADSSPPKRACVEDVAGTVTLILSDGKMVLPRKIALKAALIHATVGESVPAEDGDGSGSEDEDETVEVPLPTVTMAVMKTVVSFLKHHATKPYTPVPKPLPSKNMEDLVKDKFDLALVTKPDEEDIRVFLARTSQLLSTAEYLGIAPLIQLCMVPFAVRLKGVQQSQALENFGLPADTPFTKEDEEQILRDYPWIQTDM